MKFFKFLLIAGLVFGVSTSAKAANVVDYTGNFWDMEDVAFDQSGTVDGSAFGNAVVSYIGGSLAADSTITFTYTFTNDLLASTLVDVNGSYSFTEGGVDYAGYTTALLPSNVSFAFGTKDLVSSTALAVASAQITDPNTISVVIQNLSSNIVDFTTAVAGMMSGAGDYEVEYSVSSVPLPAALPMFGFGLGALALRSRRKNKVNA